MDQPAPGTLDVLYAPPGASPARSDIAKGLRRRAAKLLLVSVVGFGVAFAVMLVAPSSSIPALLFVLSALTSATGAGHALYALAKGVTVSAGTGAALSALGIAATNVFMMALGAITALLSTMSFTRGRQIRAFGRILLAPVVPGSAWSEPTTKADLALAPATEALDADTRAALAAQWRENGRTEHASVAAFARLTLDLVALGAPPELVGAANQDALDEIRHAELCFALARRLDGVAARPGAFPAAARARTLSRMRSIALAELAVDSLVDGALHEGVSARVVAKLARRCADPAIAAMLKEIAADEGRHARHGWDVVRWCLDEGGVAVAGALLGALRTLPTAMRSPLPEEARAGGWERFGIMGAALEAEEYEAARADVVRRVTELAGRAAPPSVAA